MEDSPDKLVGFREPPQQLPEEQVEPTLKPVLLRQVQRLLQEQEELEEHLLLRTTILLELQVVPVEMTLLMEFKTADQTVLPEIPEISDLEEQPVSWGEAEQEESLIPLPIQHQPLLEHRVEEEEAVGQEVLLDRQLPVMEELEVPIPEQVVVVEVQLKPVALVLLLRVVGETVALAT